MGTMVKFTTNQLLIFSNFEDFSPSTKILNNFIRKSYFYQSLMVVVEVYLNNQVFITLYDCLNFCDLLELVKFVTFIEAMLGSWFTKLAISNRESKWKFTMPRHFFYSKIFELLKTYVYKLHHLLYVWNIYSICHEANCVFSNDSLALCDWLEHQSLCSHL